MPRLAHDQAPALLRQVDDCLAIAHGAPADSAYDPDRSPLIQIEPRVEAMPAGPQGVTTMFVL